MTYGVILSLAHISIAGTAFLTRRHGEANSTHNRDVFYIIPEVCDMVRVRVRLCVRARLFLVTVDVHFHASVMADQVDI